MQKLIITAVCALLCCSLLACGAEPEPSDDAVNEPDPAATWDARLDGVVEDGQPLPDAEKAALSSEDAGFTTDPQVVYQYPELESGCEIAALVSALRAEGFDATTTEIADDYLTVDGDYKYGYLASPYTDFGGGFPPGVVDAANAYLAAQGSDLRARDLTGSTFTALSALVDAGYPVVTWTTLEQTPPNYDASLGAIDDWYVNEHCITIYAVNATTVTAADPLKGLVELDAATFADVYAQCGTMALVIR